MTLAPEGDLGDEERVFVGGALRCAAKVTDVASMGEPWAFIEIADFNCPGCSLDEK